MGCRVSSMSCSCHQITPAALLTALLTAAPFVDKLPHLLSTISNNAANKKIRGQTAPRIFLLTKGGVICQQQKRRRPQEQVNPESPWEKKRSLAKRDGTNLRPLFHKNNAAKHIRRQGRHPASRRLHTPAPPQRAWSRKSCCRKSGADTQNITVRGRSVDAKPSTPSIP